jgi:hypothetical protein
LGVASLTLVANAAFAQQPRGNHQRRDPSATISAQVNPSDKNEYAPVTAMTKDGLQMKVSITVPPIKGGMGLYKEEDFHKALSTGVMLATFQTFTKYTAAEVPKNIDKIQKEISQNIGNMVSMGTMKNNKPEMATLGTNYGNATIVKITDRDDKVVFQQKAPVGSAAPKP